MLYADWFNQLPDRLASVTPEEIEFCKYNLDLNADEDEYIADATDWHKRMYALMARSRQLHIDAETDNYSPYAQDEEMLFSILESELRLQYAIPLHLEVGIFHDWKICTYIPSETTEITDELVQMFVEKVAALINASDNSCEIQIVTSDVPVVPIKPKKNVH